MREFVSANERHPESVRVFPWLRPAAGDSVSAGSAGSDGRVPNSSFAQRHGRFEPPPKNQPKIDQDDQLLYRKMISGIDLEPLKNQFCYWKSHQTNVPKVLQKSLEIGSGDPEIRRNVAQDTSIANVVLLYYFF